MKTEDIKLFHNIVNFEGLTKASELLNLPKSNLSRRIKNLEEELNIVLFHRHQRKMLLSENGRHFYDRTKPLINELELTIEEMRGNDNSELTGNLRIQLLPLPEINDLVSIILQFMANNPQINVEIIASGDEKDLIEHNIDIALYVGQYLEDSNFIARPLRAVGFGYYASHEYLNKHGYPKKEEELTDHNFIITRQPNGKIQKHLPLSNGNTFQASGNLIINYFPLMLHACLNHQGIINYPCYLAEKEVQKGTLHRLFPDIKTNTMKGWLVYPKKKAISAAARALIDYILEELKKETLTTI